MISTKYSLAEQVLYRLSSGYPSSAENVQYEDIIKAIEQKVNAVFQLEHYSVTLPSGETIPDGHSLATYENIVVTSLNNGRSKCTLPIMPRNLTRNMGVFDISDSDGQVSFIPLLAMQRILLKSQPLINDLLGEIGYEVKGKKVEFTKDLTLLGMDTVTMQLAVFDIDLYAETDALPIPAGMEQGIIDDLVQQFAGAEQAPQLKPTK